MRLQQTAAHMVAQIAKERWDEPQQFLEIRDGKALQTCLVLSCADQASAGRLREGLNVTDHITAGQFHNLVTAAAFGRDDLEGTPVDDVKRVAQLSRVV